MLSIHSLSFIFVYCLLYLKLNTGGGFGGPMKGASGGFGGMKSSSSMNKSAAGAGFGSGGMQQPAGGQGTFLAFFPSIDFLSQFMICAFNFSLY